jgi:glycerol-3-phosphate dehydrogenase
VINNNDDMIQKMLRDEFSGDTSKVQNDKKIKFDFTLKTRDEHLKALVENQFDLLIIGGGANGSGVALDAASRGLKCAVVDAFDFASGTSSRSTKMAHGGVRYFE